MKARRQFIISGLLFLLFLIFTFLVMKVDVASVGPQSSSVGLASMNQFMHEKIGVHLIWDKITDWVSVIALLEAVGFGAFGLMQLIKRKSFAKVDTDILLLGASYAAAAAIYVFFEIFIVNYRPILMEGQLEASYPSSHTFIVLCILGTAMIQFHRRIKQPGLRVLMQILSVVLLTVTVVGRLISGVHWATDIAAGILLSAALVMLYSAAIEAVKQKKLN
ncbi:phosphatase PAP2 family protein [Anaerolentibacter hominis]|uniref:phosphatase PAP2 family protein n=1 Tax=Anaerolentibacter hominis TaxID=3079009 RepID=UPI0031B88C78